MSSRPTSKVYRKTTPPLHNGLGMKNLLVRVDGGILGGEIWNRGLDVGMVGWCLFLGGGGNPARADQPGGVTEKETVSVENLKCCASTRPRFAVHPY